MKRNLFRLAGIAAVIPVLALAVSSVHDAYASCTIDYDVFTIDEWQSNPAGSFGTGQSPQPIVDVSWASTGQAPWTLYASATPGNSDNLATEDVTPSTATIASDGANEVPFTITGSLNDTLEDGLYEISNWDGTHFACSGSHQITILKP